MTTREQAALICQIAASMPEQDVEAGYDGIREAMGFTDDALELAAGAWLYVVDTLIEASLADQTDDAEVNAEAEALIREGWVP